MKRRTASFLLIVLVLFGIAPTAVARDFGPSRYSAGALAPNEAAVYETIMSLKAQYPQGMPWTNEDYYIWKGGIYKGGYGCAGFAFLLSDAAFGNLPAKMLTEFTYSDIHIGDILRMNNNSHSVIVLEVKENYVVIAEGNYKNSIHWGRVLSRDEVLCADNLLTRYPHSHIWHADTDILQPNKQSEAISPRNLSRHCNGDKSPS